MEAVAKVEWLVMRREVVGGCHRGRDDGRGHWGAGSGEGAEEEDAVMGYVPERRGGLVDRRTPRAGMRLGEVKADG